MEKKYDELTAQFAKERFMAICKEVYPEIKKISGILEKHGVGAMGSLTVDPKSGYFTFSTHESQWEMVQVGSDYPVKIRYEFTEEINLEEVKEDGRQEQPKAE